jgi:hypothetical protein
MATFDRKSAHDSGPTPRPGEHVELIAVEAAIRDAGDIEEWYRDQLLEEVWSLGEFYRRHERSTAAARLTAGD